MDIDVFDRKEQRKFGILMGVILPALGAYLAYKHGLDATAPRVLFVLGGVFLVLGVALPVALLPVFYLWIRLSIVLNWVMTRVLLTLVFFLAITPTHYLHRIFSREDPLKRDWRADVETFWDTPEEPPSEFERYKDQF